MPIQNEVVEEAPKSVFEDLNNLIASSSESSRNKSAPQELLNDPFTLEFTPQPIPRQSCMLPDNFLGGLVPEIEG